MKQTMRFTLLIGAVWLVGVWMLWLDARPIQASQDRPVIKRGMLQVMVSDTDAAVIELLNLIPTFNSYIIEQRQWDDSDNFRYASLTIGVPVNRFEALLQALKRLGTAQNESVTGQDVVAESVDLQSRLDNLQETQIRLRTFLDVATNVTETLHVHQELVQIENEIGDLQGRLNFLTNRADASTITIDLIPFVPTATPTPTATATATPTATPLPTPENWRPGDTVKVASVQLQETAQNTADFLIYRLIVCTPWLLVWAMLTWGGWQIAKRRKR